MDNLLIENLYNLFTAVNGIKTESNKDIYFFCGNKNNVENALLNLIVSEKITIENINPIAQESCDEKKMALIFEQVDYIYKPTPPIGLSLDRLKIIFNTLDKMKIDIGINFDWIESIFFVIVIIRNRYLAKTDSDLKPYITKKDVCEFIQNGEKIIDKFFEIFSVDAININKSKVNMLIKAEEKYFLIYLCHFAYDAFRILEDYVIADMENDKKNKYYNLRGKEFELYCRDIFKTIFFISPYKNLKYNFKGSQEIDLFLELENNYLAIECKSSKFIDGNDFYNKKDIEQEIKNSIGKGYKTLNTFKEYQNMGETQKLKFKNGNKEIEFPNKPTIPIVLTLSDLRFVAGNITKYEDLLKASFYPVSLSIMDFVTITMNCSPKSLIDYLIKREDLLNTKGNITVDIDEVDAYGMIKNNLYGSIIDKNFKSVDITLLVKNSAYREIANKNFNNSYLNYLKDKNFNKHDLFKQVGFLEYFVITERIK